MKMTSESIPEVTINYGSESEPLRGYRKAACESRTTKRNKTVCVFAFFLNKKKEKKDINNNEEFDPGSG